MPTYIQNAESKWKHIHQNIMQSRDEKDTDGEPGFKVVELRKYIKDVLKKDISDDKVKAVFVDLDVDHKNYVSQPVFVKEMSRAPRREAFESAFDMRDYNRDGKLSQDEINAALKMVGVKDEDAAKFFKTVDMNKDGYISKKEFMKMV